MARKEKKSSEELFDEYYSSIWGERWETLKSSLLSDKAEQISVPNTEPKYWLDEASLLVASLLPIEKGSTVLDMCAAPGGKSLVLAQKIGQEGFLTVNDRSPERRERLRKTLTLLPPELTPEVRVTGFNAESWGVYEKEVYDAILLDAPCSSERHVLLDPKHLSIWSPNRPKRLSVSQYSMLSSALLAAKKGAWILYSTCSINPGENEEVIKKLFKRHSDEIEECSSFPSWAERREYGGMVLPDRSQGRGPMYFCLLRKKDNG